jgi:hypothetical protein
MILFLFENGYCFGWFDGPVSQSIDWLIDW